jgi:hypothetical protein
MAKTFYTEKEIEDLVRSGQRSLVVSEEVVLTDLAYEKANKLGLELRRSDGPALSAPAAPVRPYINQQAPAARAQSAPKSVALPAKPSAVPTAAAPRRADLRQRVQAAVKARLGDQFDPALLDAIIDRVIDNTGIG